MTEKHHSPPLDATEAQYGFGRGRPLTPEEKEAMARQQAELIRTGRTRKGTIILNTSLRRAIFIGGLAGMVILALALAVAA